MPALQSRPSESALLIGREKTVWGRTHWRIVERAMAFLAQRGIGVIVMCRQCRQALQKRLDRDEGVLHLECPHADRIVRLGKKGFRH